MKRIIAIYILFLYFISSSSMANNQCNGIADVAINQIISDSSSEQINVTDWTLTSSIVSRCPVDILPNPVTLGEEVYLWTRIAGNKKSLDWLVREERLPLKHIWHTKRAGKWKVVDVVALENTTVNDRIKSALVEEYNNRGFWDWRVNSSKANLTKGLWRVTVVDKTGGSVMCGKEEKCRISFKVE